MGWNGISPHARPRRDLHTPASPQQGPQPALALQARLQRLLHGAPGAPVCGEEPEGGPPRARPAGAPGASAQGRRHRTVRPSGPAPATAEGRTRWARRVNESEASIRFLAACVVRVAVFECEVRTWSAQPSSPGLGFASSAARTAVPPHCACLWALVSGAGNLFWCLFFGLK